MGWTCGVCTGLAHHKQGHLTIAEALYRQALGLQTRQLAESNVNDGASQKRSYQPALESNGLSLDKQNSRPSQVSQP